MDPRIRFLEDTVEHATTVETNTVDLLVAHYEGSHLDRPLWNLDRCTR